MNNFTKLPVVAGIEVAMDDQGRYNLNTLHHAYEAQEGRVIDHKKPSQWLKNKQSREFIQAVQDQKGRTTDYSVLNVVNGGSNPGTFADLPLAIAYAIWLSGPELAVEVFKSVQGLKSIIDAIKTFEVPDDLPDMFVYAIQEEETGNVKLGISKDPYGRLKQLQTGNSQRLRLVSFSKAENRYDDERLLHQEAAHYHVNGEWFTSEAANYLQ